MKRALDDTAPRELAIGVDLGGTHVLAVLVDVHGHVHARKEAKIGEDSRGSQETVGQALSTCLVEVWRHARDHFAACLPLKGVGIAVPGNVDPRRGMTRYLPNFGWLEPVNLAALVLDRKAEPESATRSVRDLLGVDELHMRNDGRCAALAERHFGVAKDGKHDVMAMLTLGTGIGGALVHGGGLFDGCTFDAGDFGHHVICSGADAFQCVCGKSGCFECHASAAGLVRHWRALGGEEHISLDDARSVIQLMRDGNSTALVAFRRCRTDLATGLANLVSFYNPSLIVLGGGLSRTPELYDGLQDRVDSQTLPATRGTFSIVQSTLGADCVAMGAGWLVFDECAKPKAAK